MSKNIQLLQILDSLYIEVVRNVDTNYVNKALKNKIEQICRCLTNKAPIRFLLSCLIAKVDKPHIDIRKPYTEIGGKDTFSGRFYDENYIQDFISKYHLPCNSTTAYLTPAFRNIDRVLDRDLVLVGKPKEIYILTLEILNEITENFIPAQEPLKEILKNLILINKENEQRMSQLLEGLKHSEGNLALSSEEIVTLLEQHLKCRNSSRLPVLMITAVYDSIHNHLNEKALPINTHNAADKQTGALGDIEISLMNDEKIVTCYEIKSKKVSKFDVECAISKIKNTSIDNYIFVTTESIEQDITDFAKSLYSSLGIEFAILDCIGFIKHFLHLFHRHRNTFLNHYQELVLKEPTSAVSQPLKEAFLALRRTCESDRS